jgi:hypothetical protein
VSGSADTFSVSGSHTYTTAGSYTVLVTVTDGSGGSLSAASAVKVMRPPLTGYSAEIPSTAELPFTDGVVAVFSDPNPSDTASSFGATVAMGDGTPADSTTVTGSGGLYQVSVSHTYAVAGLYYVQTVLLWNNAVPALALADLDSTGAPGSVPALVSPDDQVNEEGDVVSLQIGSQGTVGDPLRFAATGLPDGLSINANTGLIAGTVATEGGPDRNYQVTVTATADGETQSTTFNWEVVTADAGPTVVFAVNNTIRHDDDAAVVDVPTPIDVTLYGAGPGTHTVILSAPSAMGSLDVSTLALTYKGATTVFWTASTVSTAVDDVLINVDVDGNAAPVQGGQAAQPMTDLRFTLPNVTASDTPQAMIDAGALRLPPLAQQYWAAESTKVTANYQGPDLSNKGLRLWFAILGGSASNGNAAFTSVTRPGATKVTNTGWYYSPVLAPGDYTFGISGLEGNQTAPKSAGKLRFAVTDDAGKAPLSMPPPGYKLTKTGLAAR